MQCGESPLTLSVEFVLDVRLHSTHPKYHVVLEFEAHEAALLADIRNFLIKKRLNILQEFTKVVEDKSITQFVIKSVSLKQNNS